VIISSPDKRGYLSISARLRLDWAQKAQSSLQAPDRAFKMEQRLIREPKNLRRKKSAPGRSSMALS
jgi:hypothetical protein